MFRQVADLNAEQRCTEMQNQIFELSNKLHVETERKEELLRSGADSGKELSKLKTKLDEFASDKTEQSSKLQQIESESTSLKLKLEDALRRFVFELMFAISHLILSLSTDYCVHFTVKNMLFSFKIPNTRNPGCTTKKKR